MSQQPQNQNSSTPQRPGRPGRALAVWIILLLALMGFWQLAMQRGGGDGELTYTEFLEKVNQKVVQSVVLHPAGDGEAGSITGELSEIDAGGNVRSFRVVTIISPELVQQLTEAKVPFKFEAPNTLLWSILGQGLSLLLFFLLFYFLFYRRLGAGGPGGALSFGKSRARLMSQDSKKVTFKDVAGVEEAKEEVQEIIEYLKDPKKFQRLGGRIPKGVLLVGPPGTGKTLIARAIAGEANVPFFSISGSDFVEMFVGVGASRVRDMFDQGKKNAPCIMFIDEIDAVGRSRFSGIGGGHDEREQTLNALLVEMDGFDAQEGIIIIAATNRPDVLDPALLRPGRFDRQIVVDLPTLDGREAILKIHARKVKLDAAVDLRRTARGTPGFSGADLANLVNEAALAAARRGAQAITDADLEEARDKVRWGRERRSHMLDDAEKKMTAYHETGHALCIALSKGTEPLHKVTIIPRGRSLGATFQLPTKDRYTEGRKQLLAEIVGTMGGRAAEELCFDDITTGASSDIQHATHLARQMVTQWGMSEKLGPQFLGEREELLFMGRGVNRSQDVSEATSQLIDAEVKRIIDECYARALELLRTHRKELDQIANLLIEKETLEGEDVLDLLHHGRILTPTERDADKANAPAAPAPAAPTPAADAPPAANGPEMSPAPGGESPPPLPPDATPKPPTEA
ncbi:MAG: ATP-dependent zinc metalloprotease FtsH [Kiritimatiellae bacterium]|nr:ATP-dependent zinc metalloprotease FtsH [Kiritimatiellia bacterium]